MYLKLIKKKYFFLTLPASIVSITKGLPLIQTARPPPSQLPRITFNSLCCAHETVPPTLSQSSSIHSCSSFCAVILQLLPFFFSLLPLPIWEGKKKAPDTFNLFPHSISTFLCRAPGAALVRDAAVKRGRASAYNFRRKLSSYSRN